MGVISLQAYFERTKMEKVVSEQDIRSYTDEAFFVDEKASLEEVARLMYERGVDVIPVIGAGGKLVGTVVEDVLLDLVASLLPKYRDSGIYGLRSFAHYWAKRAGDVSEKMVYVQDDKPLGWALEVMARSRVRTLPVVDKDRKLVGILYSGRVICELLREQI